MSHTITILLFIWEIKEACSIKLSRGIVTEPGFYRPTRNIWLILASFYWYKSKILNIRRKLFLNDLVWIRS